MIKRQNPRLETFLSLTWYEVALRFLFNFVAKTSEVLLAAGLVVSTANFLTDGSILAAHPGVSIAWAWAQALAIDSSLGVSLSYAFQCFKQEEWIRGVLYGLLTLLLAGVAGGITTIDIVSHALHLSMNDAMVQMGINVTILSRLRAIAVIGFILMSRLRDLPVTALSLSAEPEPPRPVAPASGPSQELRIQTAIRSLCSQFNAEEMAQILNACVPAKKLTLAQVTSKGVPEPQQSQMDQQSQDHLPKSDSEPIGTKTTQGEPESSAVPLLESEPEPISFMEPPRKDPEPSSQALRVPGPISGSPLQKQEAEQAIAREPPSGVIMQPEFDGVPQQRLEQAYQSLVAEGKKPSGRGLAERAHIHRSTCVEWLRVKQQQATENELSLAVPEMEMIDQELALYEAVDNVSPGISPDSSLPEDTLGV